jgi:hypothetical protein
LASRLHSFSKIRHISHLTCRRRRPQWGRKSCHLLLSGFFSARPVPSQSRPPHVFGVVAIATTLGRTWQDQPARVQGPIVPSSNHQLQLPFTEQIRRYLRRRHFSHTNHISISHNAPTSAIYTESLVLLGAASARETTGLVGHALDCLGQVCPFHACVVACANQQQILSLSIGAGRRRLCRVLWR